MTTIIIPKADWIAKGGVEIQLEDGPALFAYKSTIDGKLVVEVETDVAAELPTHNEDGSPEMRVRLNEANLDLDTDLGSDFVEEDL